MILRAFCHKRITFQSATLTMKKFVEALIPGNFYHIYNRASGDEKIFMEERNYGFFMNLFEERMLEYVDLFCYCLIPNHFHFLVRIKQAQNGESNDVNYAKKFGNFFAAYAQSFNHLYHRKGNLFSQNFRRKLIKDTDYLRAVVIYIHRNPLKHGIVDNINDWCHSSYHEYMNINPIYCRNRDVLDWFGNLNIFRYCHNLDPDSDIE
jgi:REP element-mobilizing transposase RayT